MEASEKIIYFIICLNEEIYVFIYYYFETALFDIPFFVQTIIKR